MPLNATMLMICPTLHTTPIYSSSSPIFCLTPDYGLDYIAGCQLSGFHPHPDEPPLFMVARHARIENAELIKMVDLR